MKKVLFSKVCNQWLESKKFSVKYSTYVKYEGIIERNIIPHFKNLKINELNDDLIILYFEKLTNEYKYASSTIVTIRFLVKSISQFIKTKYGISPCNLDLIRVSNKPNPVATLSKQQKENLSNYCFTNYNPISLAVLVALYGGLRIGEICSLKWKDFDFDDEYINVTKCVQRIKAKDPCESKTFLQVSKPKTETSVRLVPVPSFLTTYIKEYKNKYFVYSDDYILSNSTKIPDPRTIQYRFVKLCSKYHFQVKFHALRHCYATSCVRQNLDIKSISEILGHANVNTTLNLYVHSSLEQKKAQVNKISRL